MMSSFVAAVLPMMGLSGTAQADVIINIDQVGSDVVATGTGTINLTDLGGADSGANGAGLQANNSTLIMGPTHGTAFEEATITGPTSFGPGGVAPDPTTGTGDIFGIYEPLGYLVVPHNYSSGTFLSATDTYSGATFSSLGLTPGTYTWNWGTGANADFLTVNIGTASVPEPASLVMLGTGAAAVLGYVRRRRRAAA
jgi:hypothetical protein